MKTILVSLVSAQTIPNLQLIKEMKEVDSYLFLTTKEMDILGTLNWLVNSAHIQDKAIEQITIDPFSFEDIENKLAEKINKDNKYIVNLTGGTKIMSLAVSDYFKRIGNAEFTYLPGKQNRINIFSDKGSNESMLSVEINLEEYLTAFGFEIISRGKSVKQIDTTKSILNYFLNSFNADIDAPILELLRSEFRGKKIGEINAIENLPELLIRMGFKEEEGNKLSKAEIKYLTGEWFEEYIYNLIKAQDKIAAENIGMGWFLRKMDTTNEFDVICLVNQKLHIYECKTSIYKNVEQTETIISETIYKSDSLRNKLGLFTSTFIVTLSDSTNPKLQSHQKRADANNVKIIGREDIMNESELINYLNIR